MPGSHNHIYAGLSGADRPDTVDNATGQNALPGEKPPLDSADGGFGHLSMYVVIERHHIFPGIRSADRSGKDDKSPRIDPVGFTQKEVQR